MISEDKVNSVSQYNENQYRENIFQSLSHKTCSYYMQIMLEFLVFDIVLTRLGGGVRRRERKVEHA